MFKFQKLTLSEKCLYSEFFWFVFSPNAGKYGPEKLRIQRLFTHCDIVPFYQGYTHFSDIYKEPRSNSAMKLVYDYNSKSAISKLQLGVRRLSKRNLTVLNYWHKIQTFSHPKCYIS